MISMLPIPILLVLEMTLIQICLLWNKFHCTLRITNLGNISLWATVLKDITALISKFSCHLQYKLKIQMLSRCMFLYPYCNSVQTPLLQVTYACCLCLQARHTPEHYKNIDFEALIIVSIWINANSFDVCKEGKCLVTPELSSTDLENCFQAFHTSSSSRLE